MKYLTAGESHGEKISVIVDGVPSGVGLSENDINFELKRRSSGPGRCSRQDEESNSAKIVSGLTDGLTNGNPVCVEIENTASVNEENNYVVRPGHGDLAGLMKHNFENFESVAERTSARETAARIVAGVISKNLLASFGVEVYGYVSSIGSAKMKEDLTNMPGTLPDMTSIGISEVLCSDAKASQNMLKQIEKAKNAGDSLGGAITLTCVGAVAGLGGYSQGYDRIDSKIAQAVMSVPSVKEICIGSADYVCEKLGSEALDLIHKTETGISQDTNYSGGIEAGMTNGMPVVVRAKVKPVPTIAKEMPAIDLETGKEISWASDRRSDVCVVPNVAVVCESELAFVIANAYLEKFGSDCLEDIILAVDSYKTRIGVSN